MEGQYERQDYKVEGGILKTLVGNKITGLSMHHQAILDPGPHLIPTIRHGEIIKALEHPNGHTYLFQFHIEYAHGLNYRADISFNNAYIFPYLGKLADDYHQKKNESRIPHNIADAA